MDHRDRSLGGEAVGIAEEVAIEHDVADDDDAAAPGARHEVGDALSRQSKAGEGGHG